MLHFTRFAYNHNCIRSYNKITLRIYIKAEMRATVSVTILATSLTHLAVKGGDRIDYVNDYVILT